MYELLRQAQQGLVDDALRFQRQLQGNELSHSPFRFLQVSLPNAFDRGSSRGANFLNDICTQVGFTTSKEITIGAVRSNHLVPNTLPAFYFEMTVTSPGSARSGDSAWSIAIGLFRSGFPLKGMPGSQNSYAYSSQAGEVHSSG